MKATMKPVDPLKATMSESETLNASFGIMNEIVKIMETDYNHLTNKPQINSVELIGNKTFPELGVDKITNREIEALFT